MNEKIRILLLEDSSNDAEIIQRFLLKQKLQCEFHLVTNKESFIRALHDFSPQVILSDNSMPGFSAVEALQITRMKKRDTPFIMVTGTVSEEFAASIIKQGADDYILKDRMNRLPAAIEAALKQRKAEKDILDYKYALQNGYIVTISDKHGILLYANDNFCDISGYTQEELTGQPHKIISAGIHSPAYAESIWAMVRNGNVWRGEHCNKTKDGRLYWVNVTIVPFLDENAVPYQYVSMCTDITEKKQMEAALQKSNERFQYATEASSDIIWELDFKTSEYLVHDGREKIAGFNKIPDWQLGIDGKHVSPADKNRITTSFHNAQITPACDLWKEEYRVYSAENNLLYITNHAIFIRNEKGEPLKAIGAITDITEKRKLEMELIEQARNEQLKMIAAAVEAQEKERHAIGLELHDNVNQILLGTKLLLSVVKKEAKKNEKLIADCLDNISKAIEENRKIAHVLVIPDFDTISLTDQLYSLTDSMFAPTGIKVVLDTIDIDEALLETKFKLPVYRIAQEQCSNIVKYAGAKNVYVRLYVTGDVFHMSISDDGKGADPDKKTTGIGLNNIRGRLSILNGTASIHTASGKGFRLEIEFPVEKKLE